MRICYLSNSGSVHFARWYEYFIKRGHQVYLVSGDTSGLEYKLDVPGLKVYYLPEKKLKNRILSFGLNLGRLPVIESRLKKILSDIRPDVIHAHQLHPYGFWAAVSGFRPFVLTPIGSDVVIHAMKYPVYRRMARYVLGKADVVTGDSLVLRDCCIKIGLEKDRYNLIQNGVDLSLFTPERDGREEGLRKRFDIKNDSPVVFFGRAFEPLYNVDKIIMAVTRLLKKFPDCKFVFAHHFGGLDRKFKDLVRRLDILDSVRFLGFVDHREMPLYMRMSDVFISVPSSDNSPISVYEAMACGVPTLISRLPWTDYAMRNLENTYMIDEITPSSIADAIVRLLEDKSLREKIKDGGRETVKKSFSYHSNMRSMEEIMTGLLKR